MEEKYSESPFSGPGRKTKLSLAEAVAVVSLLVLTGGVLCAALLMASRNRVEEILLDPYIELSIEGADGYGRACAKFDGEGFCVELEEKMLSRAKKLLPSRASLTEEEIRELAETVAGDPVFEYSVYKAVSDDGKDEKQSHMENLSNGDVVTLYVTISDEKQDLLSEKGFSLAFDCNPLEMAVGGLPEAVPYDPFGELNVDFSGFDGAGLVSVVYRGQYPIVFSCMPAEHLHNGDTITVEGEFTSGYNMEKFVSEYHAVPADLEKEYVVSGLLINPTSIKDFTVDNLKDLSEQGKTAALILIQDEYGEDEDVVRIENAGMYYARSGEIKEGENGGAGEGPGGEDTGSGESESPEEEKEKTDEESGTDSTGTDSTGTDREAGKDRGGETAGDRPAGQKVDNFLVCAFEVNYSDQKGQEMKYYYYIRYDNLVLDETGSLIADYTKVKHPEKSSTPIELIFGEGDDVTLPGLLNFKTLAGFKSLDELYKKAVAPFENEYQVSYLIQP